MRIKICGLSRPEDIDAANACMPDYIGFVFAPSRRRVSTEQACRLKARLNSAIPVVGVFVNETPERIAELLQLGIIDIAQLHGSEDTAYISRLRSLADAPIVKAIALPTQALVHAWEGVTDYLLMDSAAGGSGEPFAWSDMPIPDTPWFLAGGLNAENLEEAAQYRPFCLDLSSSVETGGIKDPDKIIQIVQKARKLP